MDGEATVFPLLLNACPKLEGKVPLSLLKETCPARGKSGAQWGFLGVLLLEAS